MFLIKRVTDPRLAARICDSFGAPENGSFAYAATKGDEVLGTAVFFTAPGGCVTLAGADTGRRLDVGLVDGMARAAFTAQMRAGALSAKLGEGLSEELRLALTKLITCEAKRLKAEKSSDTGCSSSRGPAGRSPRTVRLM